jgi:hypothetical protein
MERNSMLLLHEHSDFSLTVAVTRSFVLLVLQGEIKLAGKLTYCVYRNVFPLRETVRFCAHLLTGISKQLKIFYRSKLPDALYCVVELQNSFKL